MQGVQLFESVHVFFLNSDVDITNGGEKSVQTVLFVSSVWEILYLMRINSGFFMEEARK